MRHTIVLSFRFNKRGRRSTLCSCRSYARQFTLAWLVTLEQSLVCALCENLFVGGLQRGGDRLTPRFGTTVRRHTQVVLAQLFLEPLPHLRSTLFQYPRAYTEFLAHRKELAAPGSQLRKDGHERYCF